MFWPPVQAFRPRWQFIKKFRLSQLVNIFNAYPLFKMVWQHCGLENFSRLFGFNCALTSCREIRMEAMGFDSKCSVTEKSLEEVEIGDGSHKF